MYTLIQNELLEALTEILNPPWYDSAVIIATVSGLIVALGSYITASVHRGTEEKRMTNELSIKNLELEQHRKDRIHDKQLQAFDEYLDIYHDTLPTIWPNSDYTHCDAKNDVFVNLNTLLAKLDEYLKKNKSILPKKILVTINDIVYHCNMNQENVARIASPDTVLSDSEIDTADYIIEKLSEIDNQFRESLRI